VNIDKTSNGPAVISKQPTVGYNTSSSDIIVTDQPGIAVVSQAKPDGKRKPKDFVLNSFYESTFKLWSMKDNSTFNIKKILERDDKV
jgi:ABC-type hemin transport system substrate-binding protein